LNIAESRARLVAGVPRAGGGGGALQEGELPCPSRFAAAAFACRGAGLAPPIRRRGRRLSTAPGAG
jgi:hypothetical protein